MFGLDADTPAIESVLGADPVLGPLVAARPGLRIAGCFDGFELAVRAVLGQQVSVAAGAPSPPASPPSTASRWPRPQRA